MERNISTGTERTHPPKTEEKWLCPFVSDSGKKTEVKWEKKRQPLHKLTKKGKKQNKQHWCMVRVCLAF
jgi:hypothetical protein